MSLFLHALLQFIGSYVWNVWCLRLGFTHCPFSFLVLLRPLLDNQVETTAFQEDIPAFLAYFCFGIVSFCLMYYILPFEFEISVIFVNSIFLNKKIQFNTTCFH